MHTFRHLPPDDASLVWTCTQESCGQVSMLCTMDARSPRTTVRAASPTNPVLPTLSQVVPADPTTNEIRAPRHALRRGLNQKGWAVTLAAEPAPRSRVRSAVPPARTFLAAFSEYSVCAILERANSTVLGSLSPPLALMAGGGDLQDLRPATHLNSLPRSPTGSVFRMRFLQAHSRLTASRACRRSPSASGWQEVCPVALPPTCLPPPPRLSRGVQIRGRAREHELGRLQRRR